MLRARCCGWSTWRWRRRSGSRRASPSSTVSSAWPVPASLTPSAEPGCVEVDAPADDARGDLPQPPALLVTGEESKAQVSFRATRLGGAERVEILAEIRPGTRSARRSNVSGRPFALIDSVQTLYSPDVGSAPVGFTGVEAAARLLRVGKEAGVALFLVGHVTKDGAVAGPRVLEHLADCVLQFEGDRYHARTESYAPQRTGSAWPNELGIFEMTGAGLTTLDPRRSSEPPARKSRLGGLRAEGRVRCCSRSRHWSRRPTWPCPGASRPESTRSVWR